MRNRCVAILALLTVLLASFDCGCAAQKEPGRYHSKESESSIKLPDSWETREGVMGTAVIALSPREGATDEFRENVNVVVEELPSGMALEGYIEASLSNMRKLATDYNQVEDGRTTIDGVDASRLVYTHRMGQLDLQCLLYIIVKGRRGYNVTCSALQDTFETHRGRFEEIVATFRFE
jgi:hypothetical protein